MNAEPATAYFAAAIRDAHGNQARPGIILARAGRIVAAGRPEDIPARQLRDARRVDLPDRILLPAFVNAHCHLDLTGLGPRAYEGDFAAWLRDVASRRPTDADGLRAAIHQGVQHCRKAGVEFVGDLAYEPEAIRFRLETRLPGVSYLEVFGLGSRQAQRIAQLDERLEKLPFETPVAGHARGILIGVSPHAPYTAGPEIYSHASHLGEDRAYRLCTHAAETQEELQFLRDGTGQAADHARHYGCTDADIADTVSGLHPIEHLKPHLRRARWLLAHCNHVGDDQIRLIQRTGTSVVYCPSASDYFGHRPHRYREMLDAGINVCLGSDSILCHPADEAGFAGQPLSILGEMRLLHRRDATDPDTLLAMGTVNGMYALEFHDREVTFEPGAPAIFSTVRIDPDNPTDPLRQTLENNQPVEPVRDEAFPVAGELQPTG